MTREEANRIADAILEAESAERERCAKMLEDRASTLSVSGRPVFTAYAAAEELDEIAKRIKEGGHA
jgi:exopolyphosphatase/pppGpp-phosphohydrolase